MGLHLPFTTTLNWLYPEDCSQCVLSPIVWLSPLFLGWILWLDLSLPLVAQVMILDMTRRTFLWHRKMNNTGISMTDSVSLRSVDSGIKLDSPVSTGLFWKIPYLSEISWPDFRVFLKVHESKEPLDKEQRHTTYLPESKIISMVLSHFRETILKAPTEYVAVTLGN